MSPALQQGLDVLLDFQFTVKYREGKLNVLPDHISRLYEVEYENRVWGVPSGSLPWKFDIPAEMINESINARAVVMEEVHEDNGQVEYNDNEVNDGKGDTVSSSRIDRGGNAPEVALEFELNDDFIDNDPELEFKSNDDLIEALMEIERRV